MKIAIKREQNPNLFEILSSVSNSREEKIKVWDCYTRERIFPGVTKILLKMKLTLIVILFSFLGTIASETYSQTTRLSLELKNETVEHVLGTIEEKSDFYFLYSAEMIDVNRKVSVNILNSPVEKILDLLFEGTGVTYTVKGRQVVLLPGKDLVVQQQPLSVSGRVTDSAGTALPGVTVAIENTTQGTITDAQGNYSLPNVPSDATLVFSFVGMKSQEIGVAGKRNINVAMEEETVGIEEVVAIGYGTQKKLSVTGSISSINTDEIKQSTTGNLTNILGGRLSGIISAETSGSPGSGSSILIRGMSTYNNNSPLSIVDGVPRSFSELDPNEIQSITILKDASAAAVYGSRAANGVILVTTKRGLQGRPKFSYNFSAGVQNPTQYPDLLNAFEYASIYNNALLNMGYDPNNAGQAGRFYNAQQLADFKSGKVGVNWYNATFRDNAPQQTHNLNVNGGTDAIRYFFSLGYFDQDGMYEDIGYKRYNLRSNVDANINKNFSFSVDLDGRIEDIKEPGISAYSLFHAVVRTRPTYNAYSENGLPSDVGGEHPVEDVKSKGYYTSQLSYLTGSLGLNHKLDFVTKGLSAKIRYSGTRYFSLDKRLSLPYTMYRFDADGNITGTKIEGNKTAFSESFNGEKSYVANISLNYGRTFNNLHNITGLALYEQSEGFGDSFWASRTNYISNGIAQLFAGGDEDKNNNGSGYETGRKSWLGRVTYDFNNRYLFETSVRCDASVLFPEKGRWGIFPSVSMGWVISEEKFMKQFSALDFLKIRASYGQLGNDRGISPFQFISTYRYTNGAVIGDEITKGLEQGVEPNPDITWEKATTSNIGLESRLWNGLLGVEFDLFYKRTSDILAKKITSTPSTYGAGLPDVNYAIVDNKGIDLLLTHRNSIKSFKYYINGTFTFARNKVKRIDDPVNQKEYKIRTGKPLNFITGYKTLGLFQSDEEAANWMTTQFDRVPKAGDIKYVDTSGDGKVDIDDEVVISKLNYMPEIVYGLNLSGEWKTFDFMANFQGAANRTIMYSGAARTMFVGGGTNNTFSYMKDYWSIDNTDAKYPRAWLDNQPNNQYDSEFWLRDGSYVKLKSIELGYSLGTRTLKKVGFEKLRVFVSATNLLTISKLKDFDPEISDGAGAYYPQQKTFNGGINLTF